jgi:hypothetical protein
VLAVPVRWAARAAPEITSEKRLQGFAELPNVHFGIEALVHHQAAEGSHEKQTDRPGIQRGVDFSARLTAADQLCCT